MPAPFNQLFPQGTPRANLHGQELMVRVLATPAWAWMQLILIKAGSAALQRAESFAVDQAARCVFRSFYFHAADASEVPLQGWGTI
jgi:hypothetical protein